MSYTGRTRAVIRDALLSTWATEYAAAGERLLIAPGSDAYLWASALAVQLEGLEAQAESVERDILPDQASNEAVARHGYVDGVDRGGGVHARCAVTVTGTGPGLKPIPAGTRMAFSDGTLYSVDSATVTFGSGPPYLGSIDALAVDVGAAGNRAAGDVLTFVATPSGIGISPTGAVTSTSTVGTDVESYASWAARIIARRQERPASGNRSDWQAWVESYLGTTVHRAYVYPLLAPPVSYPGAGTPSTPGCVTVVAVGPAQGDALVNTRVVPLDDSGGTHTPGAALPLIRGYIEGTHTIGGIATTTGSELRPVTMVAANAAVQAISVAPQNVVLSCTMNAANAFPWTGALTIVSSSPTTLVVSGDARTLAGKRALVVPTTGTAVRGTTISIILGTGVYATGSTTFNQTASPCGTPSGSVYPCPANWDTIRTAVFAYFDGLGPGDTSPASRWPAESSEARATLYRTALAADVIASPGILSCTTSTPSSDVTPAAKTVVTLGTLIVTP